MNDKKRKKLQMEVYVSNLVLKIDSLPHTVGVWDFFQVSIFQDTMKNQ